MPNSLLRASTLALAATLSACNNSATDPLEGIPTNDQLIQTAQSAGMVRVTVPDPDPGIPAYARLNPELNQFFHNGEWLAIPFYRAPAAIPADFNLLNFFHFPSEFGPGAFHTPILTSGFYFIEDGALPGTFPSLSMSTGNAVPFWFVKWADFQAAMADGPVTIGDVMAMHPLKGTATKFNETLKPRMDDHLVVISANGQLEDGRRFSFHVTHVGDKTRAIRITFAR